MSVELTVKQEVILQVAKGLFVKNGYTETTMRDIAKALNIKASALYNHISAKEEILEWIFDSVRCRFDKIRVDLINSSMGSSEKFSVFISRYITEILRDQEAYELYGNYWNINQKFRNSYKESRQVFIDFVKTILNQNQVVKTVDCLHEDAPVMIILASLNLIPQFLTNKENPDIDCVVYDFQKKLLGGFHGKN